MGYDIGRHVVINWTCFHLGGYLYIVRLGIHAYAFIYKHNEYTALVSTEKHYIGEPTDTGYKGSADIVTIVDS